MFSRFAKPGRPRALVIVFWAVLALTVVYHLVSPSPLWLRPIFALNVLALIGCWRLLSWVPDRRLRSFIVPAGFVVLVVCLGLTGSAEVHTPLLLLGVANVSLVMGVRRGTVVMLAVVVMMVTVALALDAAPLDLLFEILVITVITGFVMAMAAAIIESREDKERADALLDQVRELTLAEERARMAREMHDSLGQQLTVVKLGLENAARMRTRDPEAAWTEVAKAKDLTAKALQDTRQWVRALRPLPQGTPVDSRALNQLAESFAAAGLTVRFTSSGPDGSFDIATQQVLYRTMQEGLTNAVRHSHAATVDASLTVEAGRVRLAIRDDGDPGPIAEGFGLSSLRERAQSLGGTLRIDTDSGFTMTIDLPVVRENA